MKKLMTLLSVGALAAFAAPAQTAGSVNGYPTTTVGGNVYVTVNTQATRIDPGYKYSYTATGDYTKVYTAFLKDGVETNKRDLVGTDGNLAYFDMARLANGYSLVFSTSTGTSTSSLDKVINWNKGKEGGILIPIPKDGYKVNDYIQFHFADDMKGDNERKAQLCSYDNGTEQKYAYTDKKCAQVHSDGSQNWFEDSEKASDYQSVWYNADENCFSFKLVNPTLVDWANSGIVYLNGDNVHIASWDYERDGVTYSDKKGDSEGEGEGESSSTLTEFSLTQSNDRIDVITEMGDVKPVETVEKTTYNTTDTWNPGYTQWGTTGENAPKKINDQLKDLLSQTPDKKFKEGDVINVYVDEGDKRAQLWWKDDSGNEKKYGNSADSSKNNGWGTGDFGGAQDCQYPNTGSENYYDFVLTSEMATQLNTRMDVDNNFATQKDICFTGEGVTPTKITYVVTKTTTSEVAEGSEYRLYNLWNAKDDKDYADSGFVAGMWGFTQQADGFYEFDKWATDNNAHADIEKVERYFTNTLEDGDNKPDYYPYDKHWNDAKGIISPEYWAAVIPRFDVKKGDKLLLAFEADDNTWDANEWNTNKDNQCWLQLWYMKEDAEGKLTADFYKFGDKNEIDVYNSDGRFNKNLRYVLLTLDTDSKIAAAKNGMRFKGCNFKLHRIDWIHAFTPEELVTTTTTKTYYIHAMPQAFTKHNHWDNVSFKAAGALPSQDKDNGHDGSAVGEDKDNTHRFAEDIFINFMSKEFKLGQPNTTLEMNFYTFLPGSGARFNLNEFLEPDFIADHMIPDAAADNSTWGDKDENGELKDPEGTVQPLYKDGYKPMGTDKAGKGNTFPNEFYAELNIAGWETYACECDEYKDKDTDSDAKKEENKKHREMKTWYKPLSNLVAAIEANGIYCQVTITTTETNPAFMKRRVVAKALDPNTGLDFKQLEGDLKDDFIEYALPEGMTEVPIHFNQAGIKAIKIGGAAIPTEVEGIGAENAPAEYYNLQGIRVSTEDLTPGIYVVRQGSKTSKIVVE